MTALAIDWRDQRSVPPPLDMWAEARAAVPQAEDFTARHQRGTVTLPWTINPVPGERQGDVLPAWVCCDPACGGVELDEWSLDREHGCCDPHRTGQQAVRGWHRVGLGRAGFRGFTHGPYAPYWAPDGAP